MGGLWVQEDNNIEKDQLLSQIDMSEMTQTEQDEQAEPLLTATQEPAIIEQTPVAEDSLEVANNNSVEQSATIKSLNNPGTLVLQWLVYAFWGWTVLAVSIMTWAIISFYMDGLNISDTALYGVAALLVLLPLSLGCDIFYHKKEPEVKTGAASVIMIIHSVIFALFGIGSLISAVLSGVNLLIGDNTIGVLNTLFTSLIIFAIYLSVFLRTILLKK